MATPIYEPTQDGRVKCTRHDVLFGRAESCGQCLDDPGPPPDEDLDDESVIAPEGCKTSEDVERDYYAAADEVLSLIHKLTGKTKRRKVKDGEEVERDPTLDLHALNTAAKLREAWLKCMRSAHECTSYRERKTRLERREREKRDFERGGASH